MDRPKTSVIPSRLDFLPENAQRSIEEGFEWVKSHPTEAMIAGAAAGFVLGLTGFGRAYRGVRSLQAVPIVSQLILGAVVKGMASRQYRSRPDSIH